MRHPLYLSCSKCSQPLTAQRGKFNLVSTLSTFYGWTFHRQGLPESVDAATPALYKSTNGGGRNPAAAVL
jgi:hypothetical protein